jgi:hypothetical protein
MLKKIILGIVITAVLSVTAFGTVYAYQKEKTLADRVNAGQDQVTNYGPGPGQGIGDCEEGEDCLREEERVRNNLRLRENEDSACAEQDGEENRWQHRYEYEEQFSGDGCGECFGKEQDSGTNSNTGKGNNGNGRNIR